MAKRVSPQSKTEGTATPEALAKLARTREDFLDDPSPDPDQVELARDEVATEPSIGYALARSETLAVVKDGDLDIAPKYFASLRKTVKALQTCVAEVSAD